MSNFEKLDVWQKAIEFADNEQIYAAPEEQSRMLSGLRNYLGTH